MSHDQTKPTCVECGKVIQGDVLILEGEGPMHGGYWRKWIGKQ